MKMEAKGSYKTLMPVHQATRHHFSEDRNPTYSSRLAGNDL